MKNLILAILKKIGWMKLLAMTWDAIYPSLEEIAKKTNTRLDDDMLKVLDKVISDLVTVGDIVD